MPNYNTFTPGNKNNIRPYINRMLLLNRNSIDTESLPLCVCNPVISKYTNNGWNDSSQTQKMRISKTITGTLGGKTTFGNGNTPATINYLGGIYGQPGGTPRPLRNKF